MTEWLARFFNRSAGGEIEGHTAHRDALGKTLYTPERRSEKRLPFSGRPALKEEDFHRISSFTLEVTGIQTTASDIKLLEGRLMNRLRTLHIGTFREYAGYLMSERGIRNELENFINAITTGKTHFWRESEHFEFILHTGAEELLRNRDSLHAWSVGCSTGEEPYTIAMTLAEHNSRTEPYVFSVMGSDISELALRKASMAEYGWSSVLNLPAHFRDSYLLKDEDIYSVRDGIKDTVSLKRINLLEEDYNIPEYQDIVFFRNVGIYFNTEIREAILQRLCRHMSPGGYLFLGHSESLEGFDLPLRHLQGTIYKRDSF